VKQYHKMVIIFSLKIVLKQRLYTLFTITPTPFTITFKSFPINIYRPKLGPL